MKIEPGWDIWYWWRFKVEWHRRQLFFLGWGDGRKPRSYRRIVPLTAPRNLACPRCHGMGDIYSHWQIAGRWCDECGGSGWIGDLKSQLLATPEQMQEWLERNLQHRIKIWARFHAEGRPSPYWQGGPI